MVKPTLSQSLKKYRNMASSTSKVVKVDTNEQQSKKSSSKKMEVQIDRKSKVKETVKVENKNTTEAAAIPTLKSSGDSVHFTSDAANNYYRAMKLGRSPPTTTGSDAAAKESMNDYMTFLRDKKQSSSTTTQQQANVITPKQPQVQVPTTTQQPQKKTREQLIAEALHITKTPTEISQYLLAQGDTIEYAEKMELYTEILTKQKELLKKKEKERAKLLNKVDKKKNNKKSMGVVNKLNILKGSSSNKNKIAAPAVITPPKADPPPTQIHPVTSFDKHTIFSAKSDITDVQYGDTTKSLEGCSVATEQYVSSGLSPNEEEDDVPTNAFVNDTTKMMNDITKAASSSAAAAEYDPPIAEYPSPINSPNEDTLGYPDDVQDPMALLDKVGLPTNMLPDRIKIDNGPTIDHLPSSPGCDGIELDLVHSPTNEDEQQEKEETQDVSKSKVRSLSPFLKTASTETTQDTDNKKKPIRSSSPLVKLKNKMTRSSSPSALPPKIPNRPIIPVDPPETRLSLDDDGSVECSGVWDDVETNANDDDDTEASDSVMIQNLPGADDDQIMLDNSHDEVEDDTDDSSKLMAIATIKRVDTAASSVPKKKKTSRMALAREKMTRLKLKKSNVAVEEKEDETAPKKAATAAAVPGVDAEPPKQELPDDHTITSTTSSKERKKEKLKKIMEYRKKASPSVQSNDQNAWASLARSESNLSERKSKKEGEKKTEDVMNRVELLELLKKEREATASSKEGSNDSNKSSSKDKEAREEAGSDTKRGEHEKQPIVREQSTFSADGVKHPVKHISVYPNASEYDDNDDMTLPPELRKSERVDIWKEAVPSQSFDSRAQTPNPKINGMTDAFLTCGEKMLELEDVDTLYDGDTLAADANTVVDKSAKDGESNTVGDQTTTKKQRNRFACGIDPEELKQDLVYEAKSIGQDVKTGIKAMGNDVKTGIRNSVRNLFGACDITNTGGVDVLDKNFSQVGDQLLGRVPMPKNRTNSTAKSSVEAPASPDKNPADDTAPAVTVNPQAEKITGILSGTDAARKHFDGVYPKQDDAEQEAEVSKELDELMQKKEKPLTVEEKKQLYLQKLKSVSMKHL